jgi:hypothetical protein
VEQLGDAVAGRYLLVAPMCPRAARRQYHAVDLTLDRTVAVRFAPRDTHDGSQRSTRHTPDGLLVLAAGTFAGTSYEVLECPGMVSLAELEALAAAPCAADPQARRGPALGGRRLRRTLVGALMAGAVLSAATLLTSTQRTPDASPSPTGPRTHVVWVSTAR